MKRELSTKPEEVFKEYYTQLSYFAFQFVNDKAVAEDLVQDAFVSYWNCARQVSDHPKAIKDFLYTAVRNSSLNHLKHRKVQEKYFRLRNDQSFEDQKVLDSIIKAETMANLYLAVMKLPEGSRRVFLLAYFEGLSNPEIAEQLDISINTVRNHKQNGLKILKSQLSLETFLIVMVTIAS